MRIGPIFRVLLGIALSSFLGCKSESPDVPALELPAGVVDEEAEAKGSEAWLFVDAVLRKHGEIPGYGDLSAGLDDLEKDYRVTIKDGEDRWNVSLWPHDDGGHDFVFGVMKDSGEMVDIFVGNIY